MLKLGLGLYIKPAAGGAVAPVDPRVYSANDNSDNLYELNVSTLAEINSGSGGGNATGIGGSGADTRLYSTIGATVGGTTFERNLDTLASLNSKAYDSAYRFTGCGGTKDQLFVCDRDQDAIHRMDLDTLAILSTVGHPDATPRGVGGTLARVFCAGNDGDTRYEHNPSTLAVINSATATSNPVGMGGTTETLYSADASAGKYYTVNQDTLATIDTFNSRVSPSGIGGIK